MCETHRKGDIEMLSNTDGYAENLGLGQFGPQGKTRDKIANSYDLSPRMVSRYLRVDTLIDELKTKIDNGEIPFTAGVSLSFLKLEEQMLVSDIMIEQGFKIDLKKSETLKRASQNRILNFKKAYEILSGEYLKKAKKKKKPKFTPKLFFFQ
jgi:ParB family chromosome partitioning protein